MLLDLRLEQGVFTVRLGDTWAGLPGCRRRCNDPVKSSCSFVLLPKMISERRHWPSYPVYAFSLAPEANNIQIYINTRRTVPSQKLLKHAIN
jgi:hypothetical protein